MRMFRHRYQVALGIGGIVLIATGCTGAPGDSALKGTLVVQDLPNFLGNPAPKAGPVDGVVSAVSGTKVVATVRATGGSFTFTLPAGTYSVTGATDGKYPLKCRAVSPVTVTAAATTSVEVTCDAL